MAEPYARWWHREGGKQTGFSYRDAQGRPITAPRALARIRALAIPPAWTGVRIAPSAATKLQAFGYDAKGRKQYRYHPDWTRRQSEAKFRRLVSFARGLPRFRAVTAAHLAQPGLGREKVLALVTRLLSEGAFRIGSERYARENRSYGLATLHHAHLAISEICLSFDFPGKHGVFQSKMVCDGGLSSFMRELARAPGSHLFQYLAEDGSWVPLASRDVNAYIKGILGPGFSSKDFRTWSGTLEAARILAATGPPENERQAKRVITRCVKEVAEALGNTPAIARSSYIAPVVFACYQRGITLESLAPAASEGYTREEVALMRMLSLEAEASRVRRFPEALARTAGA